MLSIAADSHPLLDVEAFTTVFPAPLGELSPAPALTGLLSLIAEVPVQRTESIRVAIRELLRSGGFKPTGRSKPASEYLVGAAEKGVLGSINPAVDACNAVSLHSGLPISVVDVDPLRPPLRIGLGREGDEYVFNTAGQVIDVAGLICLFDAVGPCANAVKDAQRTKTHAGTAQTLSVVWGTLSCPSHAAMTARWYRAILEDLGATTCPVEWLRG